MEKLEENLSSPITEIVIQTLYILSSIASGAAKHKKQIVEDRYFNKALEILKSSQSAPARIAVLNLIINLAWKDTEA